MFMVNNSKTKMHILTNLANKLLSKICPNILASTTVRHMDTHFGNESCEDCHDSYPMSSPRDDLRKMDAPDNTKAFKPCWQSLRRTEYKCRTDPEFNVGAFIDYQKRCLENECHDVYPISDLKFYKPTDKLKRKYPRTWVECVLKKRKVKAQCVLRPPRRQRRKPAKNTVSRCQVKPCSVNAPVCKTAEDGPCKRVKMPFCKTARIPPTCKYGDRKRARCFRRLTKYPSFSECLIDPLPDLPPTECNCLKMPSMCSVWEYYRNKKS